LTTEQATKKLEKVISQICEALREANAGTTKRGLSKVLVVRTANAVTIASDGYRPLVQIVLRIYSSPAEVLLGFDIDSCCVGYDGKDVWALQRAQRAISRRYNLVDPTRQSKSYEARLVKYARRGFTVAVPGLNRGKIDYSIYGTPIAKLAGLSKLLRFELLDYSNNGRVNLTKDITLWTRRGFEYGLLQDEAILAPTGEHRIDDSTMCYIWETGNHFCDYSSVFIPHHLNAEAIADLFKWRRYYQTTLEHSPQPYVLELIDTSSSTINLTKILDTNSIRGTKFSIPRNVEWLTENPGRQFLTGSFNPVEGDWYEGAMKRGPLSQSMTSYPSQGRPIPIPPICNPTSSDKTAKK